MPHLLAIVVALSSGLFVWHRTVREDWMLFIYPNAPDLTTHRIVEGDFYNFELCASQARHEIIMIRAGDESKRPAFECGLNCKDDGTGFYICDETRD